MHRWTLAAARAAIAMSARAETIDFDKDAVGAPPAGWTCGVTGKGKPHWSVEPDATAPSPPNVLKSA